MRRFTPSAVLGACGGASLVAAGLVVMLGNGSSALGDEVNGQTQANVSVASAITLTGLTPSFTLSGLPNTTATQDKAVSYRVTTNNTLGYLVSVRADAAALTAQDPANPDTIPISDLEVKPDEGVIWSPVGNNDVDVVHSKDSPSAAGGDLLQDDYRVHIRNVRSGTYSVTLTYTAATR
ncbi:hypothetical protein [Nonomuraea sp. B19D2]|uniref:hypothetical protein n=1 Tax=Nonomuraea sp. B19D2 TaxID=3159561 RepID=UPI0032DAB903